MRQPKDNISDNKIPALSHFDMTDSPDEIRKKIGELYHLDEAFKEIVGLGDRAVGPLGEYLAETPEVIPQPRVAAVRALGLIGTASALEQLKKTLFKYDLKDIHPVCAQAEYVVKNAVIEELLRLSPDEPYCDFLEAFRRYRLPEAVLAIVKYHILEAIPLLIEALEDDVISTRAAEALRQLGKESVPTLLQELSIKHPSGGAVESRISRQRRIFMATILSDIGDKTVKSSLTRMMEDPDPNIAGTAIAALVKLDFSPVSIKEARLLLKAALSHEWRVRENCRNIAPYLGEIGIKAALELIPLQSLPNLYGISIDISASDKCWLITYIVENAHSPHYIETLVNESPQELLKLGLSFVKSGSAISNLLLLAQHEKREIRRIIAHILRRMHEEKAVKALVHLLGDWDYKTANEARESLRMFPKEMLEHVSESEIFSVKPGWKRLLVWARLRRILHEWKQKIE